MASHKPEIIREAKLHLRLKNLSRRDDDCYIDNELITCAEYQLFLDDMQTRGKYYQPDHWTSYEFPPGSGNLPVLGVRGEDAQTFCDWLTERQSSVEAGWHYRLPYADEMPLHPQYAEWRCIADYLPLLVSHDQSAILKGILNVNKRDIPPILFDPVEPRFHRQFSERDYLRIDFLILDIYTRALALARARALALDLDLARAPARALDRDRDRDLALALARARDRALALDLARDLDLALALALALDRDRALDLARALALDLAPALDLALDRALALDLDLARDLALAPALDLDLAHDIDLALDLARDFDTVTRLVDELERVSTSNTRYPLTVTYLLRLAQVIQGLLEDAHALRLPMIHFLRFMCMLAAATLLEGSNKPTLWQRFRRWTTLKHREVEFDETLGAIISLSFLEARLTGDLPPFEGFRIVKERVEE